ncbi:MAG: 6,7-dimethyl-8-ribityllumazine synthase [Acidimicrobiia bacterium]|nr:6,7-dimethyl-8-ribityllumazine synthase [Acidimicrobiia bacterium]
MNVVDVDRSDDSGEFRIGVVVSEFNAFVTEALLSGCLEALEAAGVGHVTVARVAGALEVPVIARKLAASHDAVVAIGAVIEGETDHYTHVANAASNGIAHVALETGIPVANAVLTVRDVAHARDRSLPGPSNKGYEAAEAALQAARVLRQL